MVRNSIDVKTHAWFHIVGMSDISSHYIVNSLIESITDVRAHCAEFETLCSAALASPATSSTADTAAASATSTGAASASEQMSDLLRRLIDSLVSLTNQLRTVVPVATSTGTGTTAATSTTTAAATGTSTATGTCAATGTMAGTVLLSSVLREASGLDVLMQLARRLFALLVRTRTHTRA